jgi:hypothetical protein
MTDDRELESWREQWGSGAEPFPEIRSKIRRQQVRFALDNLAAAIAFVGFLIFAVFVRQQRDELGTGWATGVCILAFVGAGYRVWVQRRAWRPNAQSTYAFVELWHERVMARIRLIRMAGYAIPGWVVFCGVAIWANWAVIGKDVRAHPRAWSALLAAALIVTPGSLVVLGRLRRRKEAELKEVERILEEIAG